MSGLNKTAVNICIATWVIWFPYRICWERENKSQTFCHCIHWRFFFLHCIRFIILFIIGSILIKLCRVALLLPLLCWCWEIPMSVCVNQKAKEKQTYEEMKKKKQWYTNRVYERSRNVSHSFTLNEIICYTCRTIKRFVNVFYFYMYIYATNSKCQSLTVPCHTARCYAMKIGIWIHFKRKNDSQKKYICIAVWPLCFHDAKKWRLFYYFYFRLRYGHV